MGWRRWARWLSCTMSASACLRSCARRLAVTLHCPAKVENVSRSEESVSLVLDNGETLSGKLLVAADGSRSTLGARCGISWQQEPYEQLAIIANVSTGAAA